MSELTPHARADLSRAGEGYPCVPLPRYNGGMNPKDALIYSMIVLCAACGEPQEYLARDRAKRERGAANRIQIQALDFSGDRHSLSVSLHPKVDAFVRTPNDVRPVDLVLDNEAHDDLRVRGNGRRSIMFVGLGGRALFDRVLQCDSPEELRSAFPDQSLYFSPGLQSKEAVQGAVFLARVERGDNRPHEIGMARILIETLGDTSAALRVSVGPPWRTE